MKRLCSIIWDFAERHEIDLRFAAPYVFGGMIGRWPKRKK